MKYFSLGLVISFAMSSYSSAAVFQGEAHCSGKVQVKDLRHQSISIDRAAVSLKRSSVSGENRILYLGVNEATSGNFAIYGSTIEFPFGFVEDNLGKITSSYRIGFSHGSGEYHKIELSNYFSRLENHSSYDLFYESNVYNVTGRIECLGNIGTTAE